MKKLLIIALLAATPVSAQQVQQPAEYVLKMTPADVDIISEGLQTQPFGKVYPLINKLREQIIAQQPKPADVPNPTYNSK